MPLYLVSCGKPAYVIGPDLEVRGVVPPNNPGIGSLVDFRVWSISSRRYLLVMQSRDTSISSILIHRQISLSAQMHLNSFTCVSISDQRWALRKYWYKSYL